MADPRLFPRMRRFSLHKPGYRVPDWLQKRVQRFYPTVSIAWNHHFKRWMLINKVAGGWEPIGRLETQDGGYVRPTLRNTLGYLHRASTRNLRNKFAFEAWLKGFDEPEQMAEKLAEEEAMERIREGSKELWDQIHNKVVVPRVVESIKRRVAR